MFVADLYSLGKSLYAPPETLGFSGFVTALVVLIALIPTIGYPQQDTSISRVIEKLRNGSPVIGTFTRTPDADLDYAVIDAQYGTFEIADIRRVIASIERNDSVDTPAVIVRAPLANRDTPRPVVAQLVDAGVDGVMFPDVETKAQAQAAVEAMRAGQRGLWPLDPQGDLVAMIQIESPTAISNLQDILEVAGIGVLFLGPTDMALAIGAAGPDAAEVEEMVQEVLRVCLMRDIACGYPVVEPDREAAEQESARRLAEGFRVLAVMTSRR